MGRLAVVAFVIVVSCNLPIICSVDFPAVVEFIVVPIDPVVPWKHVNPFKIIRPGNLWLRIAIQVDPDKTIAVDVDMYGKETILGLVKIWQILIARGFGKLAIEAIGPTMVEASKDFSIALGFGHHWERSVSANIVECIDVAFPVFTQHKLEVGYFIAQIVARFLESEFVGGEQPSL